MARITHKVADAFIRKYNKHFAIKNYSKMKLDAKIKAIDSHTARAGGQLRQEWSTARRAAFLHKSRSRRGRKAKKTPGAEDLVGLMGMGRK